jgi:hypothetical protein
MPRRKGIQETKPRAPGAGRKHSSPTPYNDRYRADPNGSSVLRLPNRVLAQLEWEASVQGATLSEWLARLAQKATGEKLTV